MNNLYDWYDFVSVKEWWENTGNIDVTLEWLIKRGEIQNTQFATILSAMRKEGEFNTTKILEGIWENISNWDISKAISDLDILKEHHKGLVQDNFSWNSDIKNNMFAFIESEFWMIQDIMSKISPEYQLPAMINDFEVIDLRNNKEEYFSLKAFGERFCGKFYQKLLQEHNIDIEYLPLEDRILDNSDSAFWNLITRFDNVIKWWTWGNNLLIPGYPWRFAWGIDKPIGSGYSDATAAAIAVAVQKSLWKNKKVLLEILKSVDGIMSADPSLLDNPEDAQLIERLPFIIAKEIVWVRWAQAKLLNPYAMQPELIRSWISLRLRNPLNINSGGTVIDNQWDSESYGVEVILRRDNVAFISLTSIDMPQGYVSRVMDIVKKYKSIDIISTSETEISFTVDMKWENDKNIIENMEKEIISQIFWGEQDEYNFIEILYDHSLIFCIGQNMKDQVGLLAWVTTALSKTWINVEVISQAQSQRAMTFWIKKDDAKIAINILHQVFRLKK